jgi:hypothetical protein
LKPLNRNRYAAKTMSVAFEAVLLTREAVDGIGSDALECYGDVVRSAALVAVVPPPSRQFTGENFHIAKELSRFSRRAVAISYDDQSGSRFAFVFENEREAAVFGPNDEKWVLLDDDGEPQTGGPRFTIAQLSENDEAACVVTAIDLAVSALGADPRNGRELLRAIGAA